MFVIVLSPDAEVSSTLLCGFSARACAPRQREFLASLNPEVPEFISHCAPPRFGRVILAVQPGIIPQNHPALTRRSAVSTLFESQTERDSPARLAGSFRGSPTGWHQEPFCPDEVGCFGVRFYSQYLGVLETLNPTDDGRFGNGRNTYGNERV
jgi:hypothetical protein